MVLQTPLACCNEYLIQAALSDVSQLSAAFFCKTYFIIAGLNILMRAYFLNHTTLLIISLIFQQVNGLPSYFMNSNISQIIIKY